MLAYGKEMARREGPGTKEEAARYLKMSADRGNEDWMNNYGDMLQNGYGVPRNYCESVRYYKMAADLGNAEGMNNYGYMLQNGYEVQWKHICEDRLPKHGW